MTFILCLVHKLEYVDCTTFTELLHDCTETSNIEFYSMWLKIHNKHVVGDVAERPTDLQHVCVSLAYYIKMGQWFHLQ